MALRSRWRCCISLIGWRTKDVRLSWALEGGCTATSAPRVQKREQVRKGTAICRRCPAAQGERSLSMVKCPADTLRKTGRGFEGTRSRLKSKIPHSTASFCPHPRSNLTVIEGFYFLVVLIAGPDFTPTFRTKENARTTSYSPLNFCGSSVRSYSAGWPSLLSASDDRFGMLGNRHRATREALLHRQSQLFALLSQLRSYKPDICKDAIDIGNKSVD